MVVAAIFVLSKRLSSRKCCQQSMKMASNSRINQTRYTVCCIFNYRRLVNSCTQFAVASPWKAQSVSFRIGSVNGSFFTKRNDPWEVPRGAKSWENRVSLSCCTAQLGSKPLTYFRWSFKDDAFGAFLKKSIHIIKRKLKMIAKSCFH